MMRRVVCGAMAGVMALSLTGCSYTKQPLSEDGETADVALNEEGLLQVDFQDENYVDKTMVLDVSIQDEAVALSDLPALDLNMMPEHPGTAVKENSRAIVDYSNAKDGYVMAQWKSPNSTKKIKVLIQGPTTKDKWQYDLKPGEWSTFPLSDGDGKYAITVYEQTTGDRYSTVLNANLDIKLDDPFAPFLRPNQYVNYENAPKTAALSDQIIGEEKDVLTAVGLVYDWVVKNLTYDKAKAQNVKSDYLPVLDEIIEAKTGICFDYASLMTAMLRQHGVPCKLVVGYAGAAYHAWVSVYTEDQGWIDGVIYFDGTSWQRMDPTFASSGNNSSAILKYIGDGSHYTAKYLY